MSTPTIWMTVREAADRLRVSDDSIHRYIHRGYLAAAKLGTGRSAPLRIRAEDVDRLLVPVTRSA